MMTSRAFSPDGSKIVFHSEREWQVPESTSFPPWAGKRASLPGRAAGHVFLPMAARSLIGQAVGRRPRRAAEESS